MPEMHRLTVRFGVTLWRLLQEEAERDGVSAAQFVREAALVMVATRRVERGDSLHAVVRHTVDAELAER